MELLQAIAAMREDLLDGEAVETSLQERAVEFGLNPKLLLRKFVEAHGDPATVQDRHKRAQAMRGYPGRRFRINGREYEFVRFVGNHTTILAVSGGALHELEWGPIAQDVHSQWGDYDNEWVRVKNGEGR